MTETTIQNNTLRHTNSNQTNNNSSTPAIIITQLHRTYHQRIIHGQSALSMSGVSTIQERKYHYLTTASKDK
jgi:hypothetical protein